MRRKSLFEDIIFLGKELILEEQSESELERKEFKNSQNIVDRVDEPESDSTWVEGQTLDQEVKTPDDTLSMNKPSRIIRPSKRYEFMITN